MSGETLVVGSAVRLAYCNEMWKDRTLRVLVAEPDTHGHVVLADAHGAYFVHPRWTLIEAPR